MNKTFNTILQASKTTGANVIYNIVSVFFIALFDHIWYIVLIFSAVLILTAILLIIRFLRAFKRKKYYKTIDNNRTYYQWHINVLKKIYSERYITKLLNEEFAVSTIESDRNDNFDICEKIDFDNYDKIYANYEYQLNEKMFTSKTTVENLFGDHIHKKLRRKYNFLVSKNIKYPNLTGFMIDEFILNEQHKLINIKCRLGTYIQNVMTSHILEYEMYELYCKMLKNSGKAYVSDDILDFLPYRSQIHKYCNNDVEKVLRTGNGRFSLLSVQLLIIYFDKCQGEYCAIIKRRTSDKIAAKLSYIQVIPAGGFEVYEKESRLYNCRCIESSYSIKAVVYRELLEELFDIKTFEGIYDEDGNVHTSNIINGNEYVKYINNLIIQGKAKFEMLGTTIDLVSLRSNISCVLLVGKEINDFEERFINKIKFNDEFDENMGLFIPLSQFESMFDNDIMVTPDSVGLYKLFKNSSLYKKMTNS